VLVGAPAGGPRTVKAYDLVTQNNTLTLTGSQNGDRFGAAIA
jgi:hypothetical protein